ncbi:calcium/sodium antiporter [Candidatus Latescibacterota bacterium]
MMILSLIFLAAGGVLLVKGADMLIEGGVGIALKSGVSQLVVGLTIVAFGTSAPELTVSLTAAFQGKGDICFGNVVGSNIANIALILGVAAVLSPVIVNKNLFKWELPFMLIISVITMYVGYTREAGLIIGLVFLLLFAYYIYHCFKSPTETPDVDEDDAHKTYPVLILLVCVGIAGLGLGGYLFVEGATKIARLLGVSESVIALTIVAFGTSLPELFTSVIASLKKQSDISLGNIVGSNIFNILLVIGTTATIRPFSITPDTYLDYVGLPFMLIAAFLLIPFALTDRSITRFEGAVFVILYCISIVLAVIISGM